MKRLPAALCAIFVLLTGAGQGRGAEATFVEERPITAEERAHWSYLPIADVAAPQAADPAWNGHPIDAFIRRALAARGVEPLPVVSKATLLRRICFDLTGRPPTPQMMAAFERDDAPDAYDRLIDALLASPAYGLRQAQHWLDLARFAETDGFEHDLLRPNAWRYRDWVIEALNRDLPYDEFVRLQLAGDELHPDDPQSAVATGFLLCGPDMPDLNLQDERRHMVLNEMAATVGSVFLAMQVGCAQCHDHKYDPIRIHDFYRLRAFFEPADVFRDHPIPSAEELAARDAAEEARDPKFKAADERRVALETLGRERFREKNPDERPGLKQILAELGKEDNNEHKQLVKLLKDAPPLPGLSAGRVVRDGEPRECHLCLRGDFRQPAQILSCGFPRVLVDADDQLAVPEAQRRAALAEWLVSSRNPLVARVIVNRVWQSHFGVGLVESASDFGTMGSEPTHPQLLDWLAKRFVADGWSLKKLHRLIVTSRTYQLGAVAYDPAWTAEQRAAARQCWNQSQKLDPDNHLLWHHRRQRLDGEAIRDAMLVACERLSSRSGGPGIRPPLPTEVTATLLRDQWTVNGNAEDHRRASIYLFVRRNLRYPMFDVFDRPDTNASCPVRHKSTTATQSLTQFNSDFTLDCARWLAGAIGSEQDPIREAYLRVFNRPASEHEAQSGREFIARQSQRLRDEGRAAESLALPLGGPTVEDPHAAAALVDFCLALFNANAFLYVE